MYDHLLALRKAKSGYDVSAASGQTLQQTPKILGSAEIMRNQVTEPIVAYLLLPYLVPIVRPKIPQMPQNLSARAQKFGISMIKSFIGRM